MKKLLERLKSSWPGRLAAAYGQSKAGNYAAGLAFNAFMTMFPLILGLLSIVWLVVQDPNTQERLQTIVTGIFPSDAHAQLVQALQGVKRNSGLFGVISILGLVWGGTSFFTSMEFALTQIFGTRQRDALRQRVMGFLMMLLFLAALLLTAGANSAAASSLPAGQVAGFIVGALVLVALLTAIYRFVPNRSFRLAGDLARCALRGRAHRGSLADLPDLRPHRARLQYLWPAVCAVLPAGHLALFPEPAAPARRCLQPDATGSPN